VCLVVFMVAVTTVILPLVRLRGTPCSHDRRSALSSFAPYARGTLRVGVDQDNLPASLVSGHGCMHGQRGFACATFLA
jgi:hypothetical protein